MFNFLLIAPYYAMWLHKFMPRLQLKIQKKYTFMTLKQTISVLFSTTVGV